MQEHLCCQFQWKYCVRYSRLTIDNDAYLLVLDLYVHRHLLCDDVTCFCFQFVIVIFYLSKYARASCKWLSDLHRRVEGPIAFVDVITY